MPEAVGTKTIQEKAGTNLRAGRTSAFRKQTQHRHLNDSLVDNLIISTSWTYSQPPIGPHPSDFRHWRQQRAYAGVREQTPHAQNVLRRSHGTPSCRPAPSRTPTQALRTIAIRCLRYPSIQHATHLTKLSQWTTYSGTSSTASWRKNQ